MGDTRTEGGGGRQKKNMNCRRTFGYYILHIATLSKFYPELLFGRRGRGSGNIFSLCYIMTSEIRGSAKTNNLRESALISF
jgi:hypothetical protein